jgi:hypothetical protein
MKSTNNNVKKKKKKLNKNNIYIYIGKKKRILQFDDEKVLRAILLLAISKIWGGDHVRNIPDGYSVWPNM